ncbi:MAG: ABC transporter permease subunit, partial [Acidobacteria bacterium]|nr:ABC transporter permease subunit [Acidobacteriota bacterium]
MSPKRIGVIARLELRTHVRSPLLWVLAGCTAFATLTIDGGSMTGAGAEAFGNSRFALARAFSLTGLLFYGFFVSILAGMSVPRDGDARVGELLHSTPLTPGEYVSGKLAGLLAAALLAITFHVGLAILWSEGGALFGAPGVRGPFQLGSFLLPALAFLLPGAVFCAGVGFAVGARSRSAMAVWAVPVALFAVGILGLSPGPARLDALFTMLDPWGTRWLSANVFGTDRGAAFYNTAPLPFDATFLGTRLFLLSLAFGAVVLATRHLRSTQRGEGGAPPRKPARSSPVSTAAFRPLGDLGMTARPPGLVAATLEVALVELRGLAAQPGSYVFGAFALLLVVEAAGTMRGVFDSEVLLSAGGLAVSFVPVITSLGCLLLLVGLAGSFARGRRHRVDGLVRVAPVPTAALLLGPLLAGGVLVCGLVAGCGLVGLGLVAFRGEASVDPAPLALVWGLLLAPTFLVFACFVLAAACLVRDVLAVYAIGLAALFGTAALHLSGSMTWVSNWSLWGALRASDLGAFERVGPALLVNRVTMLGLAAFLT